MQVINILVLPTNLSNEQHNHRDNRKPVQSVLQNHNMSITLPQNYNFKTKYQTNKTKINIIDQLDNRLQVHSKHYKSAMQPDNHSYQQPRNKITIAAHDIFGYEQ